MALSDGSSLTLAPGASLEVKDSSARRLEMTLLKGWVRFNVDPGRGRTWVVDAGLGRVVVLGTQFTVSRTPRAVKVTVHRGSVALYGSLSERAIARLAAGESRELLAPDVDTTLATASSFQAESRTESPHGDNRSLAKSPSTRVRTPGVPAAQRSDMPDSSPFSGRGAPHSEVLHLAVGGGWTAVYFHMRSDGENVTGLAGGLATLALGIDFGL